MADEITQAGSDGLRSTLRRFTAARVGLGRTGAAVSTRDHLVFQLDHALARDAVQKQVDFPALLEALKQRGLIPTLLESAVPHDPDRRTYLLRPDLGRRLSENAIETLRKLPSVPGSIAIILVDGLSGLAIERHALPLLEALQTQLPELVLSGRRITLVRDGRVAIGDEVGEILQAGFTIVLIGERPGLSAPDSLGVYLTSDPKVGRTDAERNCISNIRSGGLGYTEAAERIAFYLKAARERGGTGFALKEGTEPMLQGATERPRQRLDK